MLKFPHRTVGTSPTYSPPRRPNIAAPAGQHEIWETPFGMLDLNVEKGVTTFTPHTGLLPPVPMRLKKKYRER